MNWGSKRVIYYALVTIVACLFGIRLGYGQTASSGKSQKPLMSQDVFKNVQLLRGIPVKEFMDTMGFFSASTNLNCVDCHSPQASLGLAGFAIDTPLKQTARKMILMQRMLNRTIFGGKRRVTCYTCHRAAEHPITVPSLLAQYSIPPNDPNAVQPLSNTAVQVGKHVSADQIIDKYIVALGGAAQLKKLTSFVAKGTYTGYDTFSEKVPIEIFANAPNQLTTVVHTQHGDSVTTYNGKQGWIAASDQLMRVLVLTGGDLEGAKIDASLSFPAQIEKEFQWRTGFPSVSINGHRVQVIQQAGMGELGAKFYFDYQSGLLVRQVRYTNTAVGAIPTQIDYSDYRPVAGVKIPFHRVVTWTDNRSTIQLSEVQPNVRIDRAKFAKPAPPTGKVDKAM